MHEIGLLWMRGSLSFLEKLCVKSFVDAGHPTILYSYEPIGGVPDGVEMRDAGEILPETGFLTHERTGSPALHSDLFRYKLLEKTDNMIWADTDAYCMRPFTTPNGHFYGWESGHHINGGVLGLPKDSATLAALLDYTRDEFAIPRWYGPEYEAELEAKKAAGDPVHAGDQPWGVWGPHAITYFLHQTGEARFALPRDGLYPFSFRDRRKMVKKKVDTALYLTENTFSVHLYGRRMRKHVAEAYHGLPHPEGLLGKLLIRHGIDPCEAPLRDCPNPDRDHPHARAFREAIAGKQYPAIALGAGDAYRDGGNKTRKISDEEKAAALLRDKGGDTQTVPTPAVAVTDLPRVEPAPLRRVTAVTTMKNEGPYIIDWVAYHMSIGFTNFLVYTNNCDDGTDEILNCLSQNGIVTRVDNPADLAAGERPQWVALKLASAHPLVTEADAYMVFDVDEYISIHVGQGRLEDLLAVSGNPELISMPWRLFGCGGVLEFVDEPVPAQFHHCAPEFVRKPHNCWGFKTLVRQPSTFTQLGVHRPGGARREEMPHWIAGSGKQFGDHYMNNGWRVSLDTWGYQLCTLNHYAVRSLDGFLVKRDRGRTNHVSRDQGLSYWNIHNRNDEQDPSIQQWLDRMRSVRQVLELTHPGLSDLHAGAVNWHRAKIAELRAREQFADLRAKLAQDPMSHQVKDAPVARDPAAPVAAPKVKTGKVPKAPSAPALMRAGHVDLVRRADGDVFALGALNQRMYEANEARAAHFLSRLTPLSEPQSNDEVLIITSLRNEGAFLLEWIAHHQAIGVTHFLIYAPACDDPTEAMLAQLARHGLVTRLTEDGEGAAKPKSLRQTLNLAAGHPLVESADWVLPLEIDEFVTVHAGSGTIADMLREMNDPNVVSLLTRVHGNAGTAQYHDGLITEGFFDCAPGVVGKVARDEDNAHGLRAENGDLPVDPQLQAWTLRSMVHSSAPAGKLGVNRPMELDPAELDALRWVNGSGLCWPAEEQADNVWRASRETAGYALVTLNQYPLRSAESYLVRLASAGIAPEQGLTDWQSRNYVQERDDRILRNVPQTRAALDTLLADPELARLQSEAVAWHRQRIAALLQEPAYRSLYEAITAPMQAKAAAAE